MRTHQRGFTLIEIAIVLVIIGLLLGGVLKGQELITSARVRNLISVQDGVKAAFFGFQDRFRAYPGDYNQASQNIANMTTTCGGGNGNGNGVIDATPVLESILAWEHLSKAGFITGTFDCNTTESLSTTPNNPYNVFLQLVFDGAYGSATSAQRHNLKTGAQIPVEIIAEVDRKIDDGRPFSGSFQFSTYRGNGAAAPQVGATAAAPNCANTTGAGIWNSTNGESNCGGAVVF
ncbi:MAG: prepilin-type N-terminal cleavage/methylation domain-containing protein [Rhodocyclaceae bacterium]|jgi:prepilin-type N-terminal cleavage/methylation domain-containing protein|nr:prepilin-type N-terminal cleavage/methylation domain-containing protein [Rhodocyclaceae bacterium]MCA3073173.1 prepilin-type N-terminal cleavage/methylation domain-containing protein [Rhodocyclaceae bacterium]MCA3090591.1 prepilin-type N-terminal cleavage/methylation domain-containing protein [Rhodocyclaceae bacterium]MCA3094817.1 prepilin-type N-terminal cleavage/methylation domain-containing protein [Rhodocyclaceae bacterium]MCA3098006.1 prepilin-type N-terminal cleavage/methylation domain